MQLVILLLAFALFDFAAAVDVCVPACQRGHECSLFGCVCPTNNYVACGGDLICDAKAGCVSPSDMCGTRVCNSFERCVDGKCSCSGKVCSSAELCFLNECYCNQTLCQIGEECIKGKCMCGSRTCSKTEVCYNKDENDKADGYSCRCNKRHCIDGEECTNIAGENPEPVLKCICKSETTTNKVCADQGKVCSSKGCVDKDNCVDVGTFCAAEKSMCFIPLYDGFMRDYCQKTCNYCGECIDDPRVTTAECEAKYTFCYNPAYLKLMTNVCPKTCKLCPDLCVDEEDAKCAFNSGFCKADGYHEVMGQKCRRTCKYCEGRCSPEEPDCLECKNTDDMCEMDGADALCDDPDMKDFMEMTCPLTCDLC